MPQTTRLRESGKATPLIDTEIVRAACLEQKASWVPTKDPAILAALKQVTHEHIRARLGAVGDLDKLQKLHAEQPDIDAIITDFNARRDRTAHILASPVASKRLEAVVTAGPIPSRVERRVGPTAIRGRRQLKD